jgi:hypothetical protein
MELVTTWRPWPKSHPEVEVDYRLPSNEDVQRARELSALRNPAQGQAQDALRAALQRAGDEGVLEAALLVLARLGLGEEQAEPKLQPALAEAVARCLRKAELPAESIDREVFGWALAALAVTDVRGFTAAGAAVAWPTTVEARLSVLRTGFYFGLTKRLVRRIDHEGAELDAEEE